MKCDIISAKVFNSIFTIFIYRKKRDFNHLPETILIFYCNLHLIELVVNSKIIRFVDKVWILKGNSIEGKGERGGTKPKITHITSTKGSYHLNLS